MVGDWVSMYPHSSPVREITGAEFSQAELHTEGSSLSHFISRDCRLGKGISILEQQWTRVGEADCVAGQGERYTYDTLQQLLEAMRGHAVWPAVRIQDLNCLQLWIQEIKKSLTDKETILF